METVHAAFRRQGLVRRREGRVLGGVIAGVGRRIGIDPWPARLLFVLVLMLIPGSQVLVYPLLWLLMPENPAWVQVGPSGSPAPTGRATAPASSASGSSRD